MDAPLRRAAFTSALSLAPGPNTVSHPIMQDAHAASGKLPPDDDAPTREEAPLLVEGFQGTPEEIERQWLEKVYRGRGDSMRQLTVRALVMGSILGGVLSLTNLYIGL